MLDKVYKKKFFEKRIRVKNKKTGFFWDFERKVRRKYKLKKKWRFWRFFKQFFLRSKKKKLFTKIRWLFFHRVVIFRQLIARYGNLLKKKVLDLHINPLNRGFFQLLNYLELRLNIFVTTIKLIPRIFKVLEVNKVIFRKKILVNFQPKRRYYLLKVGDFIQNIAHYEISQSLKKYVTLRWRRFTWSRWRQMRWRLFRRRSCRRPAQFSWKKGVVCRAFTETRYRFLLALIIRYPFWGEIMVNRRRKLTSIKFFRRLFFCF